MTWQEHAKRDGWRPDEGCGCGSPHPVYVGGNRYLIPDLMCLRCRRKI
jgi:hypothetical protein